MGGKRKFATTTSKADKEYVDGDNKTDGSWAKKVRASPEATIRRLEQELKAEKATTEQLEEELEEEAAKNEDLREEAMELEGEIRLLKRKLKNAEKDLEDAQEEIDDGKACLNDAEKEVKDMRLERDEALYNENQTDAKFKSAQKQIQALQRRLDQLEKPQPQPK